MDEWLTMFKTSPVTAIAMVLGGGVWYWIKERKEKTGESKEVDRITAALERERARADAAEDDRDAAMVRADNAFAKQLELTERFETMSRQNAEVLERMAWMTKKLEEVTGENQRLREQVVKLTDTINHLQQTIDGAR